MTIKEANIRLARARLRRAEINEEIKTLNEFLKQNKVDGHSLRERRNKEMYALYLMKNPINEIAMRYNLSTERTKIICQHMVKKHEPDSESD